MGFNADLAVPKLEWDFTRYAGPTAKGCAPEPTNEEIAEFVTGWRNYTETIRRLAMARIEAEQNKVRNQTPEESKAFLDKWASLSWEEGIAVLAEETDGLAGDLDPREVSDKHVRHCAELVATVLHNSPTVDQIMALPGRVRSVFFGWVVGQLNDPELWSVATSS